MPDPEFFFKNINPLPETNLHHYDAIVICDADRVQGDIPADAKKISAMFKKISSGRGRHNIEHQKLSVYV